jgi:hypothetical protein
MLFPISTLTFRRAILRNPASRTSEQIHAVTGFFLATISKFTAKYICCVLRSADLEDLLNKWDREDGEMSALTACFETTSHLGMPEMNLGGNVPFPQEHNEGWPFSKDSGIWALALYSQDGTCFYCLQRSTKAGSTAFQSLNS